MAEAPDRASELAELMAKIEAELAGRRTLTDVLSSVVEMAVGHIDGADEAGITVLRNERFETFAATGDLVRRVDAAQYRLRSGPCVEAAEQETVAVSGNLAADGRWPEFGVHAADLGVNSMLSARLYLEDKSDTVAALNLYAADTDAFHVRDETTTMAFAAFAASAIARAAAQDKADNLAVALNNSREIGISVGILMALHKVTREQAFDLLRLVSQRTHRKLSDIAAEVADTGALPALQDRPRRS